MSTRREARQTVSVQRVLDVVGEFDDSGGASLGLDNPEIDRLDAFASLLELVEPNPYTVRAYRRAAETTRRAAIRVAELARSGRVRELRGIGRGSRHGYPTAYRMGAVREGAIVPLRSVVSREEQCYDV